MSNIQGWTARHKIQCGDEDFDRRFTVFAADSRNAATILTPRMQEQVARFDDSIGEQVAITFVGTIMYVAICRTRSMFNGCVDKPIDGQRQSILGDAEVLRQAGDLLILEVSSMPRSWEKR